MNVVWIMNLAYFQLKIQFSFVMNWNDYFLVTKMSWSDYRYEANETCLSLKCGSLFNRIPLFYILNC